MGETAKRIAAEAEKKGLSTRDLAAMTGIPKSAMQRYTSGTTEKIALVRLQAIADALGVSSAYLAGWTDDPYYMMDGKKESPPPATRDELSELIGVLTDQQKEEAIRILRYVLQQGRE